MLESYALVTVDNAKDFLGITNGDSDSLLEMLINQMTDYIETYCDRRFITTTYTDVEYDGTGTYELQLEQYPVITFTQLEVNNAVDNTDSWSDVDTDDYWVDNDNGIITKTSLFASGKCRYRVTYEGGYASIPHDLQFACLVLVSEFFNKRKAMGVKSETLGDHSIQFEGIMRENKTIQTILANYRTITI